ncbi:Hypothetical protein PP7435_CHR4-0801 [Komagataella phaffii CBS 7435]|nr:Hypothetical protein BQ9382_C4-4225 [Komagataella phaffii CBS 7435]CCA40955.1 Hypothetical protein PP7435_CHR4-0801 [Komagataella phaffii CBS 7435]
MIRSIVKPLVGSVTQFVTEESTTDAQQGAVTSLYVTLLQVMVTRLLSSPDTKVVHICMSGSYPEDHLQNVLKSLSFGDEKKKLPLDDKTKNTILDSIWLAYPDDLNESYEQLEKLQEENSAGLSKLMIVIQDLDDMAELYAFRDFTSACATLMNFMLKLRKISQLGATVIVTNINHDSGVSMIFSYIAKFYDNKLTFSFHKGSILLEIRPLTISTELQLSTTTLSINPQTMYHMLFPSSENALIST